MKTLDYQLFRFGQGYASWGDCPEEIIKRECDFHNKPWWFLRIIGWKVKERDGIRRAEHHSDL